MKEITFEAKQSVRDYLDLMKILREEGDRLEIDESGMETLLYIGLESTAWWRNPSNHLTLPNIVYSLDLDQKRVKQAIDSLNLRPTPLINIGDFYNESYKIPCEEILETIYREEDGTRGIRPQPGRYALVDLTESGKWSYRSLATILEEHVNKKFMKRE